MPRVKLMLTCLCDAFYGEVGIATVKVLEMLGCEVVFEPDQTCCGQPPFNSGDWTEARKVARHCQSVLFRGPENVVTPSGSCAAMVCEGYEMLFPGEHFRAFELGQFVVNELGVRSMPAARSYPRRIAFHRACHGRALGLRDEQEMLLASVPGVQLVEFENPEQCCGFGGAFCVTQGRLSSGIGLEKLRTIQESGAEEIATGDMGCGMHLQGLIDRHRMNLRVRHFAEILAEVIA